MAIRGAVGLDPDIPIMIVRRGDDDTGTILQAGCSLPYATVGGIPRVEVSSRDGGRTWSLLLADFPEKMIMESVAAGIIFEDWFSSARHAVVLLYSALMSEDQLGTQPWFGWFPLLGQKIGLNEKELLAGCKDPHWVTDLMRVFELQVILRGIGDQETLADLRGRVRRFVNSVNSGSRAFLRLPNCKKRVSRIF